MKKHLTPPGGNYFEDFRVGQLLVHATPRTITDGDCSLYVALTGARHIMHSAQPVARALGYRDRTIDDLLLFNIAFGKTVPDVSLNALANLGYADVRFLLPCYPGDTIRAESEVIGLRENASGKTGIVYVRSNAYNQSDMKVLTWSRWVIVRKRNAESPIPETVIPSLAASVAADALQIPACLNARNFDVETTGGAQLWDDYNAGDLIEHPAGMTVEDSEHTMATRLYQNTANVHFDAMAMKESQFGRRLMYGGHVISVCRALSYTGLENVISILAINAGSHTNPSFGGDTFFACTEILEKFPLRGRVDVGALRLRLVGLKNQLPESSLSLKTATVVVRQNVVLDLDYTVLMPRRIV